MRSVSHRPALLPPAAIFTAVTGAHRPALPTPIDPQPVRLSSYARPTRPQLLELLTRLDHQGAALFTVAEEPTSPALHALTSRLGLGRPFVPPMYRSTPTAADDSGISRLTVSTAPGRHPAFTNTAAQSFHSDGTLQRLGEIPTSLLVCHTPAAHGGQSLLLHATTALTALADLDLPAAMALTAPGVLVRQATIGPRRDTTAGPAFDVIDGRLLSRYSVTATDRFDPDAVDDPHALARAVAFFDAAAAPGSPYRHEIRLQAGQGLLLANDRLSHGRAAYHDDPTTPRVMLRALFTRRPTLPGDDHDPR